MDTDINRIVKSDAKCTREQIETLKKMIVEGKTPAQRIGGFWDRVSKAIVDNGREREAAREKSKLTGKALTAAIESQRAELVKDNRAARIVECERASRQLYAGNF